MTVDDRVRWDERYSRVEPPPAGAVGLAAVFVPFADAFPTTGFAVDLACGRGSAALWLAGRGMDVWGFDVSPVAIEQAARRAHVHRVADHCRFVVTDLDAGLPPGPAANVVVCQRFRDARLDQDVMDRLEPDGLLAITALSEVGAKPGRHRVEPGELTRTFGALDVVTAGEADGEAWLLARRGRRYPAVRA